MRRYLIVVGFSAFWLSGVFTSPAFAQDRSGFWFAVSGGYGSAGVSCDVGDCGDDREGGGVGDLRGGWTINPRTLIGLEFKLWTKTAEVETGTDLTLDLYNVMGTITFYPSDQNFFVKGGAGGSFLDADIEVRGSKLSAELGKGFGALVGAGYDFRLNRRVAITPAVDFWFGSVGDVKFTGTTFATNWKQNVIDFTIGITFP